MYIFYCKNLKSVFYQGKTEQIKIDSEALYECNHEAQIICSDTLLIEKKKRVTNLKIDRLIIIHNAIKKGSFPCTADLRNLCACKLGIKELGSATISRDIDFLRTLFNAPIEYNAYEKGYYYEREFEIKF